jgi:hypothetical protein
MAGTTQDEESKRRRREVARIGVEPTSERMLVLAARLDVLTFDYHWVLGYGSKVGPHEFRGPIRYHNYPADFFCDGQNC